MLTSQRGRWGWQGGRRADEAKADDTNEADEPMIWRGWRVKEADLDNEAADTTEANEADETDLADKAADAIEAYVANEADVADKPDEAYEAEANEADEAKADEVPKAIVTN